MKTYDFDIDLTFIPGPEPENGFDTIYVPLTEEEATALANAQIDWRFFYRDDDDGISGDDWLIKKYAPQVYPRIRAQMEAEAADRGWTDCIQYFDEANICMGYDLGELAESMDRWKELLEKEKEIQTVYRDSLWKDREEIIKATASHQWPVIEKVPYYGTAWSGVISGNNHGGITAFLFLDRRSREIEYDKSCKAMTLKGDIWIHDLPNLCDKLEAVVEPYGANISFRNGITIIDFVPKNDGNDYKILVDVIDAIVKPIQGKQ